MIAFICDNCGHEHRGHSLQDMLCVPLPKSWWWRRAITKKREELKLCACSRTCASMLDLKWPSGSTIWQTYDPDDQETMEATFMMSTTLPEPEVDPDPEMPPPVEPYVPKGGLRR